MKFPISTVFCTILLWQAIAGIAQAETAYQQYMRLARQARNRGDFNTALINLGRAEREQPSGYNADINDELKKLLEERLESLQPTQPRYVEAIRKADKAFMDGDYNSAIASYREALTERMGDYYAVTRIKQSQCIQTEKPATGAQFQTMCPSLFPQ